MNRISYFVPVKNREGLAVGSVSDEQLATLIGVLEQAQANGKGIVFFLWKNEPDPDKGRKSIATLTVAEARDRNEAFQSRATGRKPIGNTAPPPPANDALKSLLGNAKQAPTKGW